MMGVYEFWVIELVVVNMRPFCRNKQIKKLIYKHSNKNHKESRNVHCQHNGLTSAFTRAWTSAFTRAWTRHWLARDRNSLGWLGLCIG